MYEFLKSLSFSLYGNGEIMAPKPFIKLKFMPGVDCERDC